MRPPRADAPLVDRRARGASVEDVALAYLREQGLHLLARNARFKLGELDLVMREGASVVFVEVRYRASAAYGGGAASVDRAKRRKLVRAAGMFLKRNPACARMPCRFDVVEAHGDPAGPGLRWIRAAFGTDEA